MMKTPKQFLDDNPQVFNPVRSGYTRSLDIQTLNELEAIYRANYDPHFIMTKWCKSCVFETLNRFMLLAEKEVEQEIPVETKKVGRPVGWRKKP